ncbi:MAG: SGNH/GDSL hydrolase family protein [Actinomycetes bacterium]
MSRASRAAAIARAAAYGGGGLVGAGSAVFAVLVGEAWFARRLIGPAVQAPLNADGRYEPVAGRSSRDDTTPVRLAVLGDSGAAGFGVERSELTTGAVLAQGLSDGTGLPVEYRCFAVVGAQSSHLTGQVNAALRWSPDLAAIVVGANDVTHAVPPAVSVRLLGHAVRRLRTADVEVVVGTCPDLGTVRPIPHPLKWVARQWSRSLAAAQTVGVVQAGGRSVALADLLGAGFADLPDVYFGPDRFHPSADGYRAVAEAMLPSVMAVLGYGPDDEIGPQASQTPTLGVADAAAEAVDVPGAEVSDARPSRWGRLASLRLRRQVTMPDPGSGSQP